MLTDETVRRVSGVQNDGDRLLNGGERCWLVEVGGWSGNEYELRATRYAGQAPRNPDIQVFVQSELHTIVSCLFNSIKRTNDKSLRPPSRNSVLKSGMQRTMPKRVSYRTWGPLLSTWPPPVHLQPASLCTNASRTL